MTLEVEFEVETQADTHPQLLFPGSLLVFYSFFI